MTDFLKKILFWFWNPKLVRLSNGKIIDDRKRRKHTAEVKKKIENGEIKHTGKGSTHYSIITKGKVVIKGRNL